MSRFRYKAFISYSHRDERWASWLHRALESYRVPKKLVQSREGAGGLPSRIRPVFRDRDELSSGTDLSQTVREALAASENLVVVCSPAAAASRWVKEEIREFIRLGRKDRIFCIIVDGDSAEDGSVAALFPPAIAEGGMEEPLAADVRKWADGKHLAKLKLVAGILGIRLDELRRREERRRRKLQLVYAAAALAGVALVATATVSHLNERARMAHAETLVTQIVEISQDLDEVADLETLRTIGEQLASYLETLDPGELTPESRLQIALVLRQLGEVSRLQGRSQEAMNAFQQSRDILSHLVQESPADHNAMFELGQAEFWVAYVQLDRGELDNAESAVRRYLDVSLQLHSADPNDAKWAMEVAYAFSNLGTIEQRRISSDPDTAIKYMQATMEYNRLASSLAPDDDGYRSELADSHANLADAMLAACNLDGALDSRLKNVAIAKAFFESEPANKKFKEDYSYSLSGLAGAQGAMGMTEQALANLRSAVELLSELSRVDTSNLKYRWNLAEKQGRIARLLALMDQQDEAFDMSEKIDADFRELFQIDDRVNISNRTDFTWFLMHYSKLAAGSGDITLGKSLLEESTDRLMTILKEHPDYREASHQLKMAQFQAWQQTQSPHRESRPLEDAADQAPEARSCKEAGLAARYAVMRGDNDRASDYTSYLIGRGYYEPDFVNFCRRYDICE